MSAKQIMDFNGVFEVRSKLPERLETGNHIWIRGANKKGKEIVLRVVVVEDRVQIGENLMVLVCDDPRTKEWVVPRDEASALPLTLSVMIIHKSRLDWYLGRGWSDVFWNKKLRKRRAKPRMQELDSRA